MTSRRDVTPPQHRRAALQLLSTGKVSLPELAQAMGVSTHTIWNWCRIAKIDWRRARQAVVAREWSKAAK